MSDDEPQPESEPEAVGQGSGPSSKLAALEADVRAHGEVHATVADLGERDIRAGTATFHPSLNLVTVADGKTVHRIDVAHIAHWYTPTGF